MRPALTAVEKTRPDLAIVDLSLKSGSGIDCIKDLKRLHPSLLVLVLSMHDELLYGERALRAGARGYIMKREVTKKVITAIREVLQGRLYVSEKLAAAMAEKLVDGRIRANSSPVSSLSDRELEVFQLLGTGRQTRRIAEEMHVSVKTVQAYCARIREKLHLANATELLREAVRREESRNRS